MREQFHPSHNLHGVDCPCPSCRVDYGPEPKTLNQPDVVADRGSYYGRPEDNHQCTADFWRVWAARRYGDPERGPSDALDTIVFNLAQKLSRGAYRWKDDNWVDFAGYAQNALMLPDRLRNHEPGVDGYTSPIDFVKDEDVRGKTLGSKAAARILGSVRDRFLGLPVPDGYVVCKEQDLWKAARAAVAQAFSQAHSELREDETMSGDELADMVVRASKGKAFRFRYSSRRVGDGSMELSKEVSE